MAADRTSGGLVARAATLDDLEAVTALFARCDLDELGVEDTTVADVLAEWRRPGFDLASDTFLIEAPGGRVVAYGHVYEGREGDGYVDPGHRGRGHGTWLLRRAAARAREQLAAAGRDRGRLEAWTNHADASFRRLLEREGYRPYRSQLIMRVDLDPAPPAPAWPPGVTVRGFARDADARAVHRLVQGAFADVEGQALRSFEHWEQVMVERADFDPSIWFLAERDGELVGAALCVDYGQEGWVRQLAVAAPARGQGLGLALLRQAFAEFLRRGRPVVGLAVDAENSTGATRLYGRAGMRVLRRFDRYTKELRLEPARS